MPPHAYAHAKHAASHKNPLRLVAGRPARADPRPGRRRTGARVELGELGGGTAGGRGTARPGSGAPLARRRSAFTPTRAPHPGGSHARSEHSAQRTLPHALKVAGAGAVSCRRPRGAARITRARARIAGPLTLGAAIGGGEPPGPARRERQQVRMASSLPHQRWPEPRFRLTTASRQSRPAAGAVRAARVATSAHTRQLISCSFRCWKTGNCVMASLPLRPTPRRHGALVDDQFEQLRR